MISSPLFSAHPLPEKGLGLGLGWPGVGKGLFLERCISNGSCTWEGAIMQPYMYLVMIAVHAPHAQQIPQVGCRPDLFTKVKLWFSLAHAGWIMLVKPKRRRKKRDVP